jgi:hypothetical protein
MYHFREKILYYNSIVSVRFNNVYISLNLFGGKWLYKITLKEISIRCIPILYSSILFIRFSLEIFQTSTVTINYAVRTEGLEEERCGRTIRSAGVIQRL